MTSRPPGDVHPLLAGTREEMVRSVRAARARGSRVGLVPTMGALHEGHASLLRAAREGLGPDGLLVTSVFVNPLQFAPGEDLERYPRTLDADLVVCAAEAVDVVFAPAVDEVYPGGDPQVTLEGLLEGLPEAEAKSAMADAIADAIENLSPGKVENDGEVAETARLAARRWFSKNHDKKPITRVHVIRV